MRFEFDGEVLGKVIFPIPATTGDRGPKRCDPPLHSNRFVVTPMVFTGVFSANACRKIIERGAGLALRRGGLLNAHADYRRSSVGWLEPRDETVWIYERLAATFRAVNQWYQYELLGFVEPLQFTVYEVGDEFGWHLDTGPGQASTRKLSISVQLTDGGDYEGGMLEFCATDPLGYSRAIGTVIVFPSFLPHRVRKLTSGVRRALVAWMHGPTFR